MALTTGTRIGAYEIVGLIGAGGMGEVYRARDVRLHRDVAIKVIPDSVAADPVSRGRFETEARAVAALSHPNIIAIYDFSQDGATAYAVMELLDGRTLRQLLADGPVPLRKAIDCGVQIASGLAAAHARGIVHRDLKPENVFVTRDGRAKILDFGLARPTAPAVTSATAGTIAATYTPTSPGTVLGTVGYMSPEQVRGETVDQRSDIFSLGAILYELFSGQRAFSAASAVETMNAILKEEPPDLSASGHALPPALERIVRRALEKDPAERFQSARDLGFALEALSGSSTSTAQTAVAVSSRPTRRGLVAMAVLLTVLVISAATLSIPRVRERIFERETASSAIAFLPRTYDPQTIWNARFMPNSDGVIVFSASLQGNTPELFVSRPDANTPQRIGPSGTHLLSISSQGELAVLINARFLLHRLFTGTLARMPLDGSPRPWLEDVRDADWSPDGSTLAVIRTDGNSDRLEYPVGTRIHASSGYLSEVRISPDGNRIAFMDHPSRYDDRGVVKVWDRTGGVRTISEEFWGLESLAWNPAGDVLYFAGAMSGYTYQLYAANATGAIATRRILPSPDSLYVLDIARDGRWAVIRQDQYSSVRVFLPGDAHERDLRWLDSLWYPRLSGDGSMLTFTDGNATSGGDYAVALRRTDGSPPVRLGPGDSRGISPDGKLAIGYVFSTKRIMIYPTGAGESRSVEIPTLPGSEPLGWFPDSQRIVVCGRGQGKPFRCYGQNIEGGAPVPLTPEGFNAGPFSPDGESIAVYAPDTTTQILKLRDNSLRPVAGAQAGDTVAAWTPDQRALLVVPPGAMQLDRIDLATGARSLNRRFELAGGIGINLATTATLTADTRGYAYTYSAGLSRLFLMTGAARLGVN